MTKEKKQEIQVAIKNAEPKDFDGSKGLKISVAGIDALRSPAISEGLKVLTAGMKGAFAIKFVGSAALSYPTTMISVCLDSDKYGWKRATIKGVTTTGISVLAAMDISMALDFIITKLATYSVLSATTAPVAAVILSAIAAGIISYGVSDFMDKHFVEIEKNVKNLGAKKTVNVQLDINSIVSKLNSDKNMTDFSNGFYIKYVSEFTKEEKPYFAKQIEKNKSDEIYREGKSTENRKERSETTSKTKTKKSNKIEEKKKSKNNVEIEKTNKNEDKTSDYQLKGSVQKTDVDINTELDYGELYRTKSEEIFDFLKDMQKFQEIKDGFSGLYDIPFINNLRKTDEVMNKIVNDFDNAVSDAFKIDFDVSEVFNKEKNVDFKKGGSEDTDSFSYINDKGINVREDIIYKNKKKKKYVLRVSPFETLTFDNKEDFIDKVGEIFAEEIRQASINRSYADSYFKPARF